MELHSFRTKYLLLPPSYNSSVTENLYVRICACTFECAFNTVETVDGSRFVLELRSSLMKIVFLRGEHEVQQTFCYSRFVFAEVVTEITTLAIFSMLNAMLNFAPSEGD